MIYADVHELNSVVDALKQLAPVVVGPTNEIGYPDYYWLNLKDKKVGYNRKQLSEALGDIDGLEEQLHKELSHVDELCLIIENPGYSTETGVFIYRITKDSRFFRIDHTYKDKYLWSRWESFKWSLWHDNYIPVIETSSYLHTAVHIATAYKQSMTEEHTTLHRYTISHDPPFDKNPHIDNLIRLKGLGIGEVTARKLVAKFDTLYNIFTAKESDLINTIGVAWTHKFLKGIGRAI